MNEVNLRKFNARRLCPTEFCITRSPGVVGLAKSEACNSIFLVIVGQMAQLWNMMLLQKIVEQFFVIPAQAGIGLKSAGASLAK